MFRFHTLCHLDYTEFDETHLLGEPVSLKHIEEKPVFCLQARFGCQFVDKLKCLKRHYYNDCRFGPNSLHRYASTEVPELDILRHTMHCGQPRQMIEMEDDSENQ
ncbi:hypothetical protein MTO96_028984 [Rhipicephalus appendiculatus]